MLKNGRCAECGAAFTAQRGSARFCSRKCGANYNNHRAMRGAALYDVLMHLRYDRGDAESSRSWSLLCRLAARFRDEDHRERDGRRSWESIQEVKSRNVRVVATVVANNVAGLRRPHRS